MDRALQRVYELLPKADHKYCAENFRQFATVKHSARKFKLIREATEREQLKDYLAEIRYARSFQCLGFDIEAEPLGDNTKGPDFRISQSDNEAYLEVRRFRPAGKGPPVLTASQISNLDVLEEYGNIEKEVRKAFDVMNDKFSQIRRGDCILAFWNDDEDFDEVSLERALCQFIEHPEIHSVPPGLSFVLFGSHRRDCGTGQKVYCFPMRLLKPHEERWRTELEKL